MNNIVLLLTQYGFVHTREVAIDQQISEYSKKKFNILCISPSYVNIEYWKYVYCIHTPTQIRTHQNPYVDVFTSCSFIRFFRIKYAFGAAISYTYRLQCCRMISSDHTTKIEAKKHERHYSWRSIKAQYGASSGDHSTYRFQCSWSQTFSVSFTLRYSIGLNNVHK